MRLSSNNVQSENVVSSLDSGEQQFPIHFYSVVKSGSNAPRTGLIVKKDPTILEHI